MAAGKDDLHLSAAEQERIKQAVAAAERKSGTEIVPVILACSDDYPGARWRLAIAFALLLAFAVHFIFPDLLAVWLLCLQFPAIIAGYWLSGSPLLIRPFLRTQVVAEEVHQRALQAFVELGVHETPNRTGIMIYISLLEHRAEIMCDKGINAKVSADTWPSLLEELLAAIKKGELCSGLENCIDRCADLVAEHFPPGDDDGNHLANDPVMR